MERQRMMKKRIFKDISKQNPPFLIFRKNKGKEKKSIDFVEFKVEKNEK